MIFASYFMTLFTLLSYLLSALAISLTGSLHLGYKFPKINLTTLMSKSSLIRHVIFVILMISRKFAKMSSTEMTDIAILSAVLLFFFQFTRLMFVIGVFPNTNIYVCIFIFFVYIIGLLNAILRLSILLGNKIDSDVNNQIVYTLDNVPNLFSGGSANQMQHHGTQTPLPNHSGTTKLGRLGIIAGILMVPFAMYTCYELHATRRLAEISTRASVDSARAAVDSARAAEASAKAAEASAIATQQRTDIKAVKHGMLSVESYHSKYSNAVNNHNNHNNTTNVNPHLTKKP